jgi:hypothetical protein
MGEVIDRKYNIVAISNHSGKRYTEHDGIFFKLTDALLPDMLDKYHQLALEKKADARQLRGIRLLKERVLRFQRANISVVKLPDVEEGKEEEHVCQSNAA